MMSDTTNPTEINVYYAVMEACVEMSNTLTYSEQTMAEYANLLAGVLNSIYGDADDVLAQDAEDVMNHTGDDQVGYQEQYSEDSSYYQNLETLWNSMVNASNTAVSNLANAQTQLTQFASTVNGDAQYMANEVSSAL